MIDKSNYTAIMFFCELDIMAIENKSYGFTALKLTFDELPYTIIDQFTNGNA